MVETVHKIRPQQMMDLSIPYYSQKEEEALSLYGSKACGLTSLRMVLASYGFVLDVAQLSQIASRVGAYKEEAGWIHAGLVNIARDLGLNGFRINYSMLGDRNLEEAGPILAKEGASLKEIEEFTKSVLTAREKGVLGAIDELLAKNIPVIASMETTYAQTKATHLVVIKGSDKHNFVINDPWDNGANHRLPKENFNNHWTKRAVVIYR